MFRIAHNEAISLLRRRRPTEDLAAADRIALDSLDRTVEDRSELRLLQRDLRDLAERHRAALLLRELSGLGHDEIAGVLDTTPRAVKQLIYEARTALHDCRAGRQTGCDEICRALSDGDRRALRARKVRAHLHACRGCRAFEQSLVKRPRQLAALTPCAASCRQVPRSSRRRRRRPAAVSRRRRRGCSGPSARSSVARPSWRSW